MQHSEVVLNGNKYRQVAIEKCYSPPECSTTASQGSYDVRMLIPVFTALAMSYYTLCVTYFLYLIISYFILSYFLFP